MEETEALEQPAHLPGFTEAVPASLPSSAHPGGRMLIPQTGDGACNCGAKGASAQNGNPEPPTFVYAIGRIEARFPSLAVEKEFAQVVGRAATNGLTDQQTLQSILAQRRNRYLARRMCWVFTIQGLETYLLAPRDPADLDLLIEAIRPAPSPMDVDVVIGVKGPLAPPEACNGLMIPIVLLEQVYSFERDDLLQSIPAPEKMEAKAFAAARSEVFERLTRGLIGDNAGATNEYRALNYLAMRYPAIYTRAAVEFGQGASLTAIDVRPSALSGVRSMVDVIFSFTNRRSDVTEKFSARVDVTEVYPFLASPLASYFDR